MPPKRERFNAKARQSTAGGSTHKKKARRSNGSTASQEGAAAAAAGNASFDSNAEVITQEQRRAQQLMQQMIAQNAQEQRDKPMSSKKRKRFEAYVTKQLKKEERVRLLASLAETTQDVGDRSKLLSASTLGTGRAQTGAERVEKLAKKGHGTALGARKRRAAAFQVDEDDQDGDLDGMSDDDDEDSRVSINKAAIQRELAAGPTGEVDEDASRRARIEAAMRAFEAGKAPAAAAVGSALAVGADGKPVQPVMRKRAKKNKRRRAAAAEDADSEEQDSEEEGHTGRAGRPMLERTTARGRLKASGTSWGKVAVREEDEESDSSFNSSASSEDEDEALEPKGKRVSFAADVKSPAPEEPTGDGKRKEAPPPSEESEEEAEEEQDRMLLEAMRIRGIDPRDFGMQDGEEPGSSSGGEETDEELEEERDAAIIAELKRRGLDPAEYGFDAAASDSESLQEAGSPAWEGFAEGQEGSESESSASGEEGESSESSLSESAPEIPHSRRRGLQPTKRSAGFKDWAQEAVGLPAPADADGFTLEPVGGYKVRVGDIGPQDGVARGPLGADEPLPGETSAFARKHYEEYEQLKAKNARFVHNVPVKRSAELQAARLNLPVVAEEEHIVKTITENPITIICGETGSGKTTQVPQFLFERGFGNKNGQNPGMIGITQPRRVAALSMTQRVASELSQPASVVSHQIRYDVTTAPTTAVKFMTDGVLLREMATDFLLSKYSVIIIDEAHERSVNTDILIGLLTRVVRLREQKWIAGTLKALRLVIMSATLRVSDFTDNPSLFPASAKPPVIEIAGRQHPVTVHFNRRTVHDYVAEAVTKVSKIHARLPPGGILVFLTGQQEISTVCKRLEQRYGPKAIDQRKRRPDDSEEDDPQVPREAEEIDLGIEADLAADVDDSAALQDDADALDTDDEDERHDADMPDSLKDDSDVPLHILPLYSLLASDKQMRVFEDPPEGTRLVVVATNVAETSLTIPGIRYVVDCGRAKERAFDAASGIQSYNVSWISKASAGQRAGRAGRTGPGHCYRLYSSAVFEDHFEQFSQPEILRTPIDGLVLQMKAMNIIRVASFPFPTPPSHDAIVKAERTLVHLNALEVAKVENESASAARITPLGQAMCAFPTGPRFAKLLVQGQQHGCLPFVIALVAALSVGDPFLREDALAEEADDEDEARKQRRGDYFAAMARFTALGAGLSDLYRLISAVGAYEHAGGSQHFCQENFLRPKAMEEIHKLRAQLAKLVAVSLPAAERAAVLDTKLKLPSDTQLKILRQLVTAAFVDQVAVRADLVSNVMPNGQPMRSFSKMKSCRNVPYLAAGVGDEHAYVHPSSTLFHGEPPAWVVFTEVQRSKSRVHKIKSAGGEEESVLQDGRPLLKGLTKINPAWLPTLGRSLCTFDRPAESATADLATLARAQAEGKKGAQAELTRTVLLTPRYAAGSAGAGLGWELPPVKATQKLVHGRWVTEV